MATEDGDKVASSVLAEDRLKHMSRNVRTLVPEQEGAERKTGDLVHLLDDVFATASSHIITASHKVAAWNTLCALLERISDSEAAHVRDILWTKGTWKAAFALYLSQAHFVKPKSSRQLLVSLTAVMRNGQESHAIIAEVTQDVTRSLVHGLVLGEDQGCAKTCAQALSSLLGKDVLQLQVVLDAMSHAIGPSSHSTVDNLLLVLFKWMSRADFGSTIAQLVSVILDSTQELADEPTQSDHESARIPPWSSALKVAARAGFVDLPSLRVHLLPVLFRRSASDYISFLHDLGIERLTRHCPPAPTPTWNSVDTELLYASLQTGKDLDFLRETENKQLSQENGIVYVPIHWVGHLLQEASSRARSTGFALLITSQSTTRPFSRATLGLIRRNLGHLFADVDADFRSEVSGCVQRLVDRMRAVVAALARHSSRTRDGPALPPLAVINYHKDFLRWLTRFTIRELRPAASYQRHISALKCLSILFKSGLDPGIQPQHLSKSARKETCWPFDLHIFTEESCRSLLDLLIDPFDDVRQIAASILTIGPASIINSWPSLQQAVARAEGAMLLTGRADQADGVAHGYSLVHAASQQKDRADMVQLDLCNKVRLALIAAKADLQKAVQRYPLHGLLTSIRYILIKGDENQHVRDLNCLIPLLQDVWNVVKPILCSDAPEGYLPESFEDVTEVSTKDTLSYCWRALKEASLLMGVLVSAADTKAENGGWVLCELSFAQLAELRHRGAFSTVAQTWIACCLKHWSKVRLRNWYRQSLLILRNKTRINTRRSAGLPLLLCGILVADQSGEIMQQAFADMEEIIREPVDPAFAQEGSLPQVHAMNCCKDILKTSRLGEQSERHVPSALQLAADALQSDAWAVRNCGLMLFRAVIDRLLGTSDAHLEDGKYIHRKLSAEQYPQLLDIVLALLSTPSGDSLTSQQTRQEGVFPALQLLQRLDVSDEQLQDVKQSVKAIMKSTSWHIRDRAARTYASFISEKDVVAELRRLLDTTTCDQNALHGSLLAAKYVLQTFSSSRGADDFRNGWAPIGTSVMSLLEAPHLYAGNACPVTRAAYLDLHAVAIRLNIGSRPKRCEHSISPFDKGACSSVTGTCNEMLTTVAYGQKIRSGAGAILLAPLAKLLAAQLFCLDGNEQFDVKLIISCLAQLVKRDIDAAASFFELASDLVMKNAIEGCDRTRGLEATVEAASAVLNDPGVDTGVMCAAQDLLITACTVSRQHNLQLDALSTLAQAILGHQSMMSFTGNQRSADQALVLHGALLETHKQLKYAYPLLKQWAEHCYNAIAGVGLHTREAAAHALSETTIWQNLTERALARTFLRLCFAIYDLLNDDDEDIRQLASHASTNILRTAGQGLDEDLVALVMSSRLLTFMLRRWHNDPEFVEGAFIRAFGLTDTTAIDAKADLDTRAHAGTALFAEEKQNLYIDEAREVRVWSQVLSHIAFGDVVSTFRHRLAIWVLETMEALLDKAKYSRDGPLGWSTDSEIFVLGLRTIFGAEVLLRWARDGARIHVRPSSLRRKLHELATIHQINVTWQTESERVIAESVLHNVRMLHSSVLEYSC